MADQMMKMMDMNRRKNKSFVFCVDFYLCIDIFAVMFIWYLDLRSALFSGYKFTFWSLYYFLNLNFTFFYWVMQTIDLFQRIMSS